MKTKTNWPKCFDTLWNILVTIITVFGGGCALSLNHPIYIFIFTISVIVMLTLYFFYRRAEQNDWLGLLQFISALCMFPMLKVIFLAGSRPTNSWLLQFDELLWNSHNLLKFLAPWNGPVLSNIASLFYLSFFPILFIFLIYFRLNHTANYQKMFFHGLMVIYLFGFIGYMLLPSAGPYLTTAHHKIHVIINSTSLNVLPTISLYIKTQLSVGSFPSLHMAISLYLCGLMFIYHRYFVATLMLFYSLGLFCSLIYLEYHYETDLLAAIILALFVLYYVYRNKNYLIL